MGIKPVKYIWRNGELVNWEDATLHLMSHVIHYGSSVFEGIRCYETPGGSAIFRLDDHIRRLIESAKIYRMDPEFSQQEICEACHSVIAENDLKNAYIRPFIFFGEGGLALNPYGNCKVEVAVGAFEWGTYLGADGIKHGIDVCISSWSRTTSASIPVLSKAGGHYTNAILIVTEANRNGYAEGISVGADGMISEGSGENVFLVRDGKIFTPPLASAILGGITRDTVIKIARKLGYEIIEEKLPREMLYIADEVFFSGTAAEVTPIRSVDGLPVGDGKPGPITKSIQDVFFGLFDGRAEDEWGWLDYVKTTAGKTA